MRATAAYASLRELGRPALTTRDAAHRLRISIPAANALMVRLVSAGLASRIRHGLWTLDKHVDALALPEFLTTPYPAYISLHSALWFRGVIQQIPTVVYVVSLGRPRRIRTEVATFSIHRLPASLFGGYESLEPLHVELATAEKALFDMAYLANARSRLFAHLAEIELPASFDDALARSWIARIPDPNRRSWVAARLDTLLHSAAA